MLGISGVKATVTMPTLTTDVNNPIYYTIKNFRTNKYAAYAGASTQLDQITSTASASLWYFVENGTGVSIIPADDPSVKLASTTSATAEGAVWYLVENPYNAGYFCVSLTSGATANCWDDQVSHTKIGYWQPAKNDYQGTSWTIERATTIPTGYYYFKGMDASRHPYLYSDFVAKTDDNTYHHDLPGSPSNGNIWKVTNNGTTFTATNGEGLPIIIGSTSYETLTIGSSAVGPDIYFSEAINLTTWGNDTKLTTWGGHPNATDNHWTFERADVSAGIYNVVIEGHANGYVTYSGQNAKNGGFFVAETITAGDLTACDIANYSTAISITDRTITVTYTATFTYTLTDVNGATYSWSASGTSGVVPSLTGCYGYSLSNEVWDESARTYTANITFPFPISSNDVTNWTYIGSFASLSRTAQWAWHVQNAGATDVTAQSNVLPTNEDGDIDRWKWAIEVSSFSSGAFTFKIKNSATPKYIYCSSTQHDHAQGSVTLETTGTSFVHVNGNAWKVSDASYYLSINSYQPKPADLLQYVGQYGSTHYGTNIGYITPSDFAALKADLTDTYDSFNDFYDDYFSLIGGAYTETVEGALAAAHGNNETVYNVIKDGATNYFTASQFTSYQNAYINAMNGVKYVMPTSSFIRIKNADGSKYVKAAEVSNYLLLSAGGTDASSIFYLNGSNSLIGYTTGLYTYAASVACPIGYAPTYVDLYEFLLGSTPGLVKVHATTNPTGWGHGRYWKDADAGTFVDRTQAESATDYIIEEVTSLPVTITSANYATLYAPVALTIPSGVTAYTATISGDKLVLTPVSTTIPKNTGVLLYSATPDTYNFDITDDVDAIDGNAFSGTIATINRSKTEEVYNSYILSGGSNGIGFYRDGSTTLKGFKAFVDATPSGDVKQFLQFDFGNADAIQTISNALQSEDREIYNLAGQRLNSLQRGVNIVNGKKVLVK